MKLDMFQTVLLPIIRSLFIVNSAMVYVIQVCRQLSSRTRMELQFHPAPARVRKHVEFHAGVTLGNWCIWLVLL
jgi:hypothetical protein